MTSGDYACKMQALWGCLEDEMMILIEGSLVGRDGGKGIWGILRAPVCVRCGCSSSPILILILVDLIGGSSFSCPKSPQATSHGFSPAHV